MVSNVEENKLLENDIVRDKISLGLIASDGYKACQIIFRTKIALLKLKWQQGRKLMLYVRRVKCFQLC